MIEYMLAKIIAHEFEKVVGNGQAESRKAMHIGFSMNIGNSTDQYKICHFYLFAPYNYVHVAVQEEQITENGKRIINIMKHLCYHDSCWRDAIQTFIFKNRGELNGFQSLLKLFDWYDVITLTKDEVEYLNQMDRANNHINWDTDNEIAEKLKNNPFNIRSVCYGKL